VPQLQGAIKELQKQGYDLPDYPEEPRTEADKGVKAKYAKVLGSAVNPVLREGNSDRRVAASVKQYARKHPHSMGKWSKDSKTHVASMGGGDFYSSEQSVVVQKAQKLKVELTGNRGEKTILKDGVGVKEGDVIAASALNRRALRDFFAKQIADAKAKGLLLSLHLKATMMKVSDPIMFGHAVEIYYQDVFEARRRAQGSSASSRTMASATSTRRSRRCRKPPEPLSKRISRPCTKPVRRSRWLTRAKASRTCTCRATSSSTPRCRRPFALRARCGGRTASCTT
jgi:monomeric type NADP-dependent isocitrate dehydrogenase